jgi:multiple sugar transport system permease protein
MARAFRAPQAFLLGAYVVVAGAFIVPLLWVLSLSLKTLREAYAYPPTLAPLHPTAANYVAVWTTTPIVRYFLNSLEIVAVAVLGSLAVSVPFAYALSRFRFRGKPLALFSLLVVRMISPVIIIVPLYRYYAALGLLDSLAGVAAVYIATQAPVATWVLKGFFDSIPGDLDHAAMIDGCSRFQALTRVVLPVSLPGIAAAVIFDVIFGWSQFLIPFVLLTDSKRFPIAVGILNYQSTAESISIHLLAAASIIAILPVVAVFVLLQRYIVFALTAGAVKH